MKNKTHIHNAIDSIELSKAKYDKNVKEILADIQVLARIVKYTVNEVAYLSIDEIMKCIDTESIEIGTAPITPGLTNFGRIENRQTENSILNEGYVTFDIRFVLTYGKKKCKIIINIEAQKSTDAGRLGYHLENRIIYYLSRLISSQRDGVFS